MHLRDEILIRAGVDTVWGLTVDVERWPELTPTIRSVERLDDGPIGIGSRARIVQPRQRPAIWTVTAFEPARHFEWETTTLGMRMVGRHLLEAEGDACRNLLELEVTGALAGVVAKLAGRQMLAAIQTENAGFRSAAERPAPR